MLEHVNISYDNTRAEAILDYPNKRLKVKTYQGHEPYLLADKIYDLATGRGLTKILWLLRPQDAPPLLEKGYVIEGRFSNYFRGRPALWLSFFLDPKRRYSPELAWEEEILWQLEKKKGNKKRGELPGDFYLKLATPEDVPKLARLYAETFETYPTPLAQPEYIYRTMSRDTLYLAIYEGENLASAASGVIDWENMAAEISDCATRPEYRGLGLMQVLTGAIEEELVKRKVIAIYSVARATSLSMNTVFSKAGYSFRGRLLNNCHICGRFEDMNLWTKG
ncbi:MAG: beta-lysine N6-acetyltransferase [Clostridia bacterium]|nr:beta-lysine N6-acetyltransferase [Clostridia bacterium]